MSNLASQVKATLPSGMQLPHALEEVFAWIETEGTFIDRPTGERVGFLFPDAELKRSWTDTERQGGTVIEFSAQGNKHLRHWFGHERPAVLSRLSVFARTGAEGSMAALWLSPDGEQKIVHLGSGSGSLMVCILAHDPIDFIRLLAIGYDEICWGQEFHSPPNADPSGLFIHPNTKFREWVEQTFQTVIPETGLEIVTHPDDMGAPESPDQFNRWVAASDA
jgi:hypothetical protein